MRGIRNRAGFLAALVLAFQVGTIAAASAAISCDQGPAFEHGGVSGHHEDMADCPMQNRGPACPLHAEKHGTHDCDCPSIGCSQTDTGFMALFGAVGILPTAALITIPVDPGDAATVAAEDITGLVAVPLAPPPRS